MDVEMHESERRIAEFKTQLGKSELDSYKTDNSNESTHAVSMVVHDDLPLNWQHTTADAIDSEEGHFATWARMRQRRLIKFRRESNEVTKVDHVERLISDINKILKSAKNQLAPRIGKLRKLRSDFLTLQKMVETSVSESSGDLQQR